MNETTSSDPIYVIDTSSLVEIREYIPEEEAWDVIIRLIQEGRLKTDTLVLDELKRHEPKFHERLGNFQNIFVVKRKIEHYEEAGRISYQYPRMSRPTHIYDIADPYVVALAKLTNSIVITDEKNKRQRMPVVCKSEGIKSTNLVGLILAEKQ